MVDHALGSSRSMDKVFVVYGRDGKLRDSMFTFLRAIGVQPIEWTQELAASADPAPYIGEAIDSGFGMAKAVVVLLSGDDEARLRSHFVETLDAIHERILTPQARPNVLFEAGMAFGRHPKGTVLVEVGSVRPFSDIGGRHVVRLDNSTEKRQELAVKLVSAGCAVDLSGTDWHTVGDFTPTSPRLESPLNPKPVTLKDLSVSSVYLMFGNHTSPITIDAAYEHQPLLIPEDLRNEYSFLAHQEKLRASQAGAQYFNGPNTRLIRFSERKLQNAETGYEEGGVRLTLGPASWEEYTVLNGCLDHRLPMGQTIRQRYALDNILYENDRDLSWCRLSNILSLGIVPITSDGFGLVQARNPRGVSSDPGKYTSGIAENIHRFLDEAEQGDLHRRLHPLAKPADLAVRDNADDRYAPAPGRTLSPYLTASRGLWEEVSEELFRRVPANAYQFLNICFELTKFHPVLVGVVELGLTKDEVMHLIKESPGKDHSENLRIEAVPLDHTRAEFLEILQRDWIPGGLAALVSAVGYWDNRRREQEEGGVPA